MEVKRAKMGQHRPKMSPRDQNPMDDFGGLRSTWERCGGRLEAPEGEELAELGGRSKKRKEELE
eukprot:6697620-Karenia_brevis.AAC.1